MRQRRNVIWVQDFGWNFGAFPVCDPVDVQLGRRLRSRRRLLGLTQQELGAACGVRFQQIQKYECAANRMSASVLWRLASALGVDVRYFFDGLPTGAEPVSGSDIEAA
jgi:transcriptional regulator with XRE-family HTH domain